MDAAFIALSLGYIVYVSAGFVTDALRFRLTTMLASAVLIVWGLVADNLGVVGWNAAFVIVNAFQAVRLSRREAVDLDPGDDAVREMFFPTLGPRDFLTLWTAGRKDVAASGTRLCAEGERLDDVLLLLDGTVDVRNSTGLSVTRAAPCFIGEMSYLTGEPASADVTADGDITVRSWNQEDLRNLQALNHRCAQSWQQALGVDVSRKLRSNETRFRPPTGSE